MNEHGNLASPLLSVLTVQDGAWVPGDQVELDASLRG